MTPGVERLDWRAVFGRHALVIALLAAAGCGERTYPVTLSFRLSNGSPLTAGFAAVEHDTDPAILGGGPIAADGTCRPVLRGHSAPGLPAGMYRVGVAGAVTSDFDAPPPPPLFDSSYTNPKDSGLTFAVGPGGLDQAGFTLEKRR